jgi:putative hemolysin
MEFLILLILILINGLFAMSEMSIVSSRRARLQQRVDAGSKGALIALRLANDPGKFLSTVQVGITTIGILSGAFGENAIAEKLILVFDQQPLLAPYSKTLATIIMVVAVTYCSVVLGEIVPKRLALLNPERTASFLAPTMLALARIAHPLVALFSLSSNLLLRLIGGKPQDEPPVTEEEIRVMLQQGADAGVFRKSEETMLGNVFKLDDLRVTAIMTPRHEIRLLDVDDPESECRAVLTEGRFQTLPVCRGGLDGVLGLLDTKDYLARTLRNETPSLEDAMHPAVFVPESISTIQLLETLRRRNSHVALVVDEYGSVEGMVTLTDLLEAIVGEIPGAQASAADDAVQRADGSWLFDGVLSLDRVSNLLQLSETLDSADNDYHTLGGLVMDRLGRVPSTGDCFEWAGLRFEVVDMDGNRVDRVLVAKLAPGAPSPTA